MGSLVYVLSLELLPTFITNLVSGVCVAMSLGLIPAFIASKKGEDFVAWWVYGSVLLIVAIPHALVRKPNIAGLEAQVPVIGKTAISLLK